MSRYNLGTEMRNVVAHMAELVHAESQHLSALRDMCAPLKAVATQGKPPDLQLLYFAASALHAGVAALGPAHNYPADSYPAPFG